MARIEKVNKLIKRELGTLILSGEIRDPRVSFVTITEVEVSKDLQHAWVKFSLLSDKPEDIAQAVEGLNNSRGYIRKLISQRAELRYTPEFKFVYDKGILHSVQMEKALDEIKKLNTGEESANE